MRIADFGRIIFALSLAVLGALSLFLPGFTQVWPIVPKWMPLHDAAATISAVILLVGSLALLIPRTSRAASSVLVVFLLVRIMLLHARPIVTHPLVMGVWEELGESLVCLAGAWTIFSLLPREGGVRAASGNVRIGQIVFALATLPLGLAHFVYLNLTAPLIPSWLPFHVGIAYFTGGAWIAAGLGILSGVLARLAATLVAVMVSLFTVLVWIPIVIAAPATLGNWSEIWVSAAITGAAWAVAGSFRGRLWSAVLASPGELAGT